jgi:hypothetical protein
VHAVRLPDGDRPVDPWVNGAGCLVAEPVPGADSTGFATKPDLANCPAARRAG